jgi:hypothetical protein
VDRSWEYINRSKKHELSFISSLIGSSLQCVCLDNFPSFPHCYNLRYLMLNLIFFFSNRGDANAESMFSWINHAKVMHSFENWRIKNSQNFLCGEFSLMSVHNLRRLFHGEKSSIRRTIRTCTVLHNKLSLSYANKFGEYVHFFCTVQNIRLWCCPPIPATYIGRASTCHTV